MGSIESCSVLKPFDDFACTCMHQSSFFSLQNDLVCQGPPYVSSACLGSVLQLHKAGGSCVTLL